MGCHERRRWRLYSGQTHSRATNFYEVDLVEALTASGDTDPNEAFRYWWLFFRAAAFKPSQPSDSENNWLDKIVAGSRDYAKRLGERLKERIFVTIFPHLAQGFLEDRKQRLGLKKAPTDDELRDLFEATLTLLYRLLFLLYAESRDLLPIREAPYRQASLKKIKEEIAARAGIADSEVRDKLIKAYSDSETGLYDRLGRLFRAMDQGDPSLNVPTYNGGLFLTSAGVQALACAGAGEPATQSMRSQIAKQATNPGDANPRRLKPELQLPRDARIGRFLNEHKVPDRSLALAIDRLSRDEDDKTFAVVNIDYKSLEVRHLGSIYEGLLEFKLKIADEDLTTQTEDKKEMYIPLTKAKPRRGKQVAAVVRKGDVYLSNDKSERKASGSYYTPDPIVEYIVEHTVGPVLAEKLEALRPAFRKVRKTFDREHEKTAAFPVKKSDGTPWDPREFAEEATYTAHKDLVESLFDFRVLDPAMGSGHFLVEGVDFITDRLLTFLNSFPTNPVSFALKKTRKNILEALTEQGVSVDPEKLTEINLLKRHVLKRCIYGVDLNPMAVELAKVSLWLDVFTLGATLSFLDHHLRCGNSLIGATFKDLEATVKSTSKRAGSLFGINYEPLLRAIQHVLFVNKMADATAAEVKQSSSEYDRAREDLGGYQVVLDLLVAKHFGFPKAPELLTHAQELDLSGKERFLASLENDKERDLVAQVEQLANQSDRRFFHWEIEFPEIFFEPAGATGQFVKHKDEIAAGLAGFDAVVGNPPYDELSEHAAGHELPEKGFFKATALYKDAHGGRLNIFRLFILRSLAILREGGRHSFIVPMALLADSFTGPLRRRLLTDGYVRSIAAFPQKDDPHNRVFFEAKLSTCIYVAEKRPDHDVEIIVRTYPGKSLFETPKECKVTVGLLRVLEPAGLSIPTVGAAEICKWEAVAAARRGTTLAEVARCWLGEIMFNASNAALISTSTVGPRIYRGGNVNRYRLMEDAKQGEIVYLRYEDFLSKYADDARLHHHKSPRVAFQEAAPIDNWRRLIPAYMSGDRICGHTLRYFSTDSAYDLFALLACFGSDICEWRFGLTSTNNHVNAYEVDSLPIPRFGRLRVSAADRPDVDWRRWDSVVGEAHPDISVWESDVHAEIAKSDPESGAWPDIIHDAIASAGKEMSRLGEERQRLTDDFAEWLIETLAIDEDAFSGMTHIKGGQANFDQTGWHEFTELLKRNRRACTVDVMHAGGAIESRYNEASTALKLNREKFTALDAAINRIVWQLVGLNADGSLPATARKPSEMPTT